MGSCLSGGTVLDTVSGAVGGTISGTDSGTILKNHDGGQDSFNKRFVMDRVLGEGNFAQVKLVCEKSGPKSSRIATTYACKILQKNAVLKEDTPSPPSETLIGEIEMLRSLNGKSFCLKLVALYETPNALLIITNCCAGGDMVQYLSKQEDIRTDDMSRISYQLLSAINHCAKNNILHRDIKPENIMFVTEAPGAMLQLIDFGSGTNRIIDDGGMHVTFAGIAFYNSPEMFQKKYNSNTDVFSAGVVLYVMAAGFPSESLQEAFSILHDPKRNSLRLLPDLPGNMPSEFYEMLDELLIYWHKQRKSAGELLSCAFIKFHQMSLRIGETLTLNDQITFQQNLPMSMMVKGSTNRHKIALEFKIFERKVTTLVATMLSCNELSNLISILKERCKINTSIDDRLQVVFFKELKDIINMKLRNMECLSAIEYIPEEASYDFFLYHISLLKEFSPMKGDVASTK